MDSALQPLVQNIQSLSAVQNMVQPALNNSENPAAMRASSSVAKKNTPQEKSQKAGGGKNNKEPSKHQINAKSTDSQTESSLELNPSAKKKAVDAISEKQTENSVSNLNHEKRTESNSPYINAEKQTETTASVQASINLETQTEIAASVQASINSETQHREARYTAKSAETERDNSSYANNEADRNNTFQAIDKVIPNAITEITQRIANSVESSQTSALEKPIEASNSPTLANPIETSDSSALVKIKLPAIIEKTAYGRCYKALSVLSEEQQCSVLAVFTEMQQQNKIHTNATGLFIKLSHAALNKNLSPASQSQTSAQAIFKGDPEHPNIQWGYSQSPQNTVLIAEEEQYAEIKAEQQRQKEQYREDYAQLDTLIFHCQVANISIEEQAKRYHLEYILEKFPKEVAAFKKKLQEKEK
jgi:hypothetical protein